MTLEIALRLPFSLPRLLRAGADEPEQGYHWVGQTSEPPRADRSAASPHGQTPGGEERSKYRPLGSITLGEVEEALGLFEGQLVPAHENWIAKHHFCTLPLKRIRDGRPPLIFGYVNSCFPSDGYIENVEDIELLFPRKNAPPDLVHLHRDDISLYSRMAAQSHALRVMFKALAEEAAEFAGKASAFAAGGFHPGFDAGYYDLLEMTEQNQTSYPRLYVIGSRWLAAAPESLYAEVTGKLKEMLGWGKVILNYHPGWLANGIHSLNRALGLKYKLTKYYLTEPETPDETLRLASKLTREMLSANIG